MDQADNGAPGALPPAFPFEGPQLGDREFALLSKLARDLTGISLGAHKRYLVASRLRRRLVALRLESYMDYYRLLIERDPAGEEKTRFVNAITTNKTEFFREPRHFQYLAETWVPELRVRAARTGIRRIRIWSASCSTGEEPYSIALALLQALGTSASAWDIRILASDIDTDVLERAKSGVYPASTAAAIPRPLLVTWFLRGRGDQEGFVRVRDELRRLIVFRRISLIEEPWPIRTRFDAVFCRNVMIYFDRPTRERLLDRLVRQTADGGLLFLGHSEGVFGPVNGIEHVGDTIYQRRTP